MVGVIEREALHEILSDWIEDCYGRWDAADANGVVTDSDRDATSAVDAVMELVQPVPTREQVAETLHDFDHMHTWRGGRCDDACAVAAFQRADIIFALLSTTSTGGETQS